jgi:transcriptional regulator with GAF, ATPase, and Fis domain
MMLEMEDLQRRCQELDALYGLARDLLRVDDYEQLLDAVMRRALASVGAERGFLVLLRGEELDFKIVRNWRREKLVEGRETLSRSIVLEALRRGKPLLVEDALNDRRFSGRQSVESLEIRSVLAAPLFVRERIAGALYLENRSPHRLFGPNELALFEQMIELSSRALGQCTERLFFAQRAAALEQGLLTRHEFPGIVTRDARFLRLLRSVAQVAASDLPVLVQGPSGSGKELIAHALHLNSPRAHKPLLTLNCGAISPQLLESELFGHMRGAFTGAVADRTGLIAAADGGTVFLDEAAELPRELQVKLLRTLQFGEVQPVGAARPRRVDVRFLAATNRDLEQEVREGRFREDLLYRLNAITLRVPALRERRDDILPLFRHFLAEAAGKAGRSVPAVPAELEAVLERYPWPGNVRELENETRRLLALTLPGLPLSPSSLSQRIAEAVDLKRNPAAGLPDRDLVALHLRLAGGNRSQAARNLGISREGLRKKMKRYRLA